jgi:hypothetical protein
MATNKNLIGLLFLLSILLIKCSCTEKIQIDCSQVKYNFQLPVKAYPDRDSINTGDTIWLEINESAITLKNSDGSFINFSGAANLGSVIDFQKIDSINKTFLESVNKFDLILVSGTEIRRTNLFIEYNFAEANQRYIFKLGIIPKEKGVYRIALGSSNNTYRTNDKCTKANFIINFKETVSHDYYIRLVNPNAPINVVVTNNYFFKVK